ncbi:MAG: hypothetical protein CVU28_08280 [Betaproteobacteria bacterium HGW-Betaproteobacteria-21]|nr:MAG: hypothetical protein CVU28_08280 [Betaproteobacteria bacterium HGW-Betaproteobacteria-21]
MVGDFRLSLSVAARVSRIPYAAICNAQWSPHAKAPGRIPVPDIAAVRFFGERVSTPIFRWAFPLALRLHGRALNQVRRTYGLTPLEDLRDTYTDADLALFADTPSLVPVVGGARPHVYIGPIVWSPSMANPLWWDEIASADSVYVSVGSTGNTAALPLILGALEEAGYTTMVATAGRSSISAIPGRRYVAPYLSGEAAARRARFVVCNGGTATAYQALSCAKGVLGVCSNMDQFLTMQYVQAAGAGIGLRASALTPEKLTEAIGRMGPAGAVTAAGKRLGDEFSKHRYGELFPPALASIL